MLGGELNGDPASQPLDLRLSLSGGRCSEPLVLSWAQPPPPPPAFAQEAVGRGACVIVRPSPPPEPPRAAGKQSPFQVFRWGRLAGAACAVAADLFGALFERPAPPQLPWLAGAGVSFRATESISIRRFYWSPWPKLHVSPLPERSRILGPNCRRNPRNWYLRPPPNPLFESDEGRLRSVLPTTA